MRNTIEVGDAYTFEPSCALFAETPVKPTVRNASRMQVTGEVVMIHRLHGWFRVRYRLPGIPNDQHECFRLPTATPVLPQIKYGYRRGDIRRGSYDTRYNIN